MREWNLKLGDPLCLTIAADSRLSFPEYTNDQIWEMILGGGEPSALTLQTTYGLRARQMLIFPRFQENEDTRIDPVTYTTPPVLKNFYPNYLQFKFQPFTGLDTTYTVWVPTPQVITGKVDLINTSILPRKLRLGWVTLLSPLDNSLGMTVTHMDDREVIHGKTSNLFPVFTMSGKPESGSGPYPCLAVEIELPPNTVYTLKWVLASTTDVHKSFSQAVGFLDQDWEPDFSRIELLNSQQILEIYTGDPDWDAAFSLSQKTAFQLLQGNLEQLPYLSFVLSRQPDFGYSNRGDGSEYNYLWNGQTSLDSYYLSSYLLPGAVSVLEGILRNFLIIQAAKGFIDWKPGLGGQRGHLLAQPLLASLAWRLYQVNQDRTFLSEVFQPLYNFITAWFYPEHDRDGDGLPEYDHLLQSGFEENPFFNRWQDHNQVVDISCVENPALGAFLYRECSTLIRMAHDLNLREKIHQLENFQRSLFKQVEQCWDESRSTYQYRDRDSHLSSAGMALHQTTGPGLFTLNVRFDEPRRVIIYLQGSTETTRIVGVSLSGEASNEDIREEFHARDISWLNGKAWITSQHCYTRLNEVEVKGLEPADIVRIQTVDFKAEDQTLLLPLWSSIPRYKQAQAIITQTINNPARYGQSCGIPALPGNCDEDDSSEVSLIWNYLIGEGMTAYGYRKEAADLVKRLMNRLIDNLKNEHTFRRISQVDGKRISSERNHLASLAPIGLFLNVLGVQILTPTRLILNGQNPYPMDVTLKYRGLTVTREQKLTRISFPNGQNTTWNGVGSHLLSLS